MCNGSPSSQLAAATTTKKPDEGKYVASFPVLPTNEKNVSEKIDEKSVTICHLTGLGKNRCCCSSERCSGCGGGEGKTTATAAAWVRQSRMGTSESDENWAEKEEEEVERNARSDVLFFSKLQLLAVSTVYVRPDSATSRQDFPKEVLPHSCVDSSNSHSAKFHIRTCVLQLVPRPSCCLLACMDVWEFQRLFDFLRRGRGGGGGGVAGN